MNSTDSQNSASKLTMHYNVNGFNDVNKRGEFFMHIKKFNPSIIFLCLNPEKYELLKNEISMSCNYSANERAAWGVAY